MKKILSIALGASALGLAFASFAAVSDKLQGSDTLEVSTRAIIAGGTVTTSEGTFAAAACAGVAPMTYIGGGSSKGEAAMFDNVAKDTTIVPTQITSPMSRVFGTTACKAANPGQAENMLVGLDGIAIVTKEANTQCSGGVAYDATIAVTEKNGVSGLQCAGCTTGTSDYKLADQFDLLRVIYAGMDHAAGSDVTKKDCNSDLRHTIVSSWAGLHQGCSNNAGGCDHLEHAFRRDDASGTTDTFLGLMGLPAIATVPFCNGTTDEDNDPIRRDCKANDLVCSVDSKAGVVLAVSVPEFPSGQEGNAYMVEACDTGSFKLAPATKIPLGGGDFERSCPEKKDFSVAGYCFSPVSLTGKFNCVSEKRNANVFFAKLTDDARIFNKWVRLADGSLPVDSKTLPFRGGWHRLRAECKESSSTLNIGCLAGQVDCSWGAAGREADEAVATAKSLTVKNIAMSVTTIRNWLTDPTNTAGNTYPLARGLYFNTLIGAENLAASTLAGASNEKALYDCYKTRANADFAIAKGGFFTLGSAPSCVDFNEQSACNAVATDATKALSCTTDQDCGTVGLCVGGKCDASCASTADCKGGRSCNTGKCTFTANNNACL